MPSGKSEIIPCMDKIELKSTVKSITHVWEDHTGKKLKDRSRSRLKVDERYRLSITNVEVDDVGVYHCLLDIVYTDNGGETSIDNVVNLNGKFCCLSIFFSDRCTYICCCLKFLFIIVGLFDLQLNLYIVGHSFCHHFSASVFILTGTAIIIVIVTIIVI